MKSKGLSKDRTRAVERGQARKRRGTEKAGGETFGLLSALTETQARDVMTRARTGCGKGRSKAARSGTVLRGHVQGNRLLVLSIPGKELSSFRRLMGRVLQEVNTV